MLILLPLLLLLYFHLTKNHDYWQKRNVKHDRPIPLFGNMYRNVVGTRSIVEIANELYNKHPDEKVVGFYRGTTPELIIRDLDIVRQIISTDFASFYPRGLGRNPEKEAFFMNLFHVDGDSWGLLRQRLTPAFTTTKLKKMFPLIVECAEKLQRVGEDIDFHGGECDIQELMARFTTDFIGACGFGLQLDTLNSENALFRQFSKSIFNRNRSWSNITLVVLYDLIPDIRSLLQTYLGDINILNRMAEVVRVVCAQRNNKPSGRHDFIDLLLELEMKGKITGDSIEKRGPDGSKILVEMEMDFNCMTAQVFIFFAAGFETSSSATSYTLHQLAFYPEKQKKIQNEIDQVLKKYNNKLCYDAINEMVQLKMAFKEGLRQFPSFGVLNRVCARTYTIPELGITIDPGVRIIIPVQAIQNDEKYFKYPSKFIPERFAEGSEIQNKYSYLPFGEGPRMCIGARLGEMQSLAGLAAVLHMFNVRPGCFTKPELRVRHIDNTVQSIQGSMPLRLKLRSKESGDDE